MLLSKQLCNELLIMNCLLCIGVLCPYQTYFSLQSGLRTAIGGEGDAKSDYDFLSSIEILIMDQSDVFMMQNWDHVDHLFQHLHLQPKVDHGCDYSRFGNSESR